MQCLPATERVFLQIGDVFCTPTPSVIATVLGSCVAVCLWDRVRGTGGMNHFHLPTASRATASRGVEGHAVRCPRYGDVAMDDLLDGMAALGSRPGDLVAKVFGGASVFGPPGGGVGRANTLFTLDHLDRHGVAVAARRTGGTRGMFVQLFTATGEVLVRPVR